MEFNVSLTNITSSIGQTAFQCQTVLVQMLIDVNVVSPLWFDLKISLAWFVLIACCTCL